MGKNWLIVFSLLCPGIVCAQKIKSPETFLIDANILKASKQKIKEGDATLSDALKKMIQVADQALTRGPYAVVYKSRTPPSLSKHDYMSVGPYWWPDTTKADGFPFIRRDGEVNPERHTIKDADYLKALAVDVEVLGLTYYFTGKEEYAKRAGFLLRTWFLDEKTKMNPNLNFGQAIPGITDGRGIGLIDTKSLVDIVDGVQLIKSSKAWTTKDHKQLTD